MSEFPPNHALSEDLRRTGFVQAVARGFTVLRAFGPDHNFLTMAEVARLSGLTRAGARRILLTLVELGYLGVDGRHFFATVQTLDLGQGLRPPRLWDAVRDVLRPIVTRLNETASAGVLEGGNVVYTARIRSDRVLHWDLDVGDQLPAYACSMGRVLLAALPESALDEYLHETSFSPLTRFTMTDGNSLRCSLEDVRRQGWSCVRGEVDESITAIAVPLVDSGGRTAAAIQMQLSSDRATPRLINHIILPMLQKAAATVVELL